MRNPGGGRRFEILIVEDDPGSRYLLEKALRGTPANHSVTSVADGEAAIEFVRQNGLYAQAPRPDLIFLDLHMPKKNGWEFLDDIKSDSLLKRIPVIVLTSSIDQAHVNSIYDRHANCYLRKPSDLG
jgi:chemotaxis family two-component system response regulator Rcp1